MTSFKQTPLCPNKVFVLTSFGFFSALPSDHIGAPAPTASESVFLQLSNFLKVWKHYLHQTLTKRRFLLCLLPDWKRRFQSRNPPFTVGSSSMFSHQTCPKVSKPWAIRRRFSFQFRSLQVPGSNQNQLRVTVANQFTAKNISFPPPTAA